MQNSEIPLSAAKERAAKQTASQLSAAQVECFKHDGVVHLRGVFGPEWIETLRQGLDYAVANPSPRFEARRSNSAAPGYFEDYWVWPQVPQFERFVRESAAAKCAAAVLEASRINLVMDNWFVREAGAVAHAPWHHDIAYFDFEGRMCVLWIPLDPTGPGEGIEIVRGSHQWGRLFMRVFFDDHRIAHAPGWVNGVRYELPPDVESNRSEYDIVSFDVQPGDCLLFDIRALHGSPPGVPPARTLRRFTLRMAAEDGRIRYRGDWAAGERAYFEAAGHADGDTLDSEFFPRLWPR